MIQHIYKIEKGRIIFMIKRESYLSQIRPFIDKSELIKVIVGVRRSGKSIMLELIKDELLDTSCNIKAILHCIHNNCNCHTNYIRVNFR